jgi:2-(3-amino-3-carboxypropyl)histidine synthase
MLFFVLYFREQIQKAKTAKRFGLILGTLGRQGNPLMYQRAKKLLDKHGKKSTQFLMAEIQPHKLNLIKEIDVSISYSRMLLDVY